MYLLSRWVEGIQKKRTFLVLCQIHTSVTELCCVKNGHENDFHGVGNWFYESTKHTREGTRDGGGGELKNSLKTFLVQILLQNKSHPKYIILCTQI